MKRFLCSLLLAGALVAAEAPEETFGLRNGRFWNKLGKAGDFGSGMQFGYLHGYTNGLVWGEAKDANGYYPARLSFGEIQKALDEIYSQPENVLIPIPLALTTVVLKVNGASKNEVDEFLVTMRRFSITGELPNAAPKKVE